MQSAREKQQSVCRCQPPIVKSHRGQWVEEDMTMDSIDTIEAQHTEQEVGNDYSTWDEYFEKIVVCGCYECRGKKEFKRGIVQRHYINDDLQVGTMPPTIDSDPIGIVVSPSSYFT